MPGLNYKPFRSMYVEKAYIYFYIYIWLHSPGYLGHSAHIPGYCHSDCFGTWSALLRRHIVLLIAIRPSDGDVKPGGPLGAFREEQAMSLHQVSPSPFLSSSSHTTQLHYTNSYTYSHLNLNFPQYTIQILIPHVMWSAQAVHDSKIDHA